jgi:ELWxxDGT repeat protein
MKIDLSSYSAVFRYLAVGPLVAFGLLSILATAPKGGGEDGTPSTYTVGGTVSGLVGSGLVLQNNSGDDLAISGNGAFTFATALADGRLYNVTVFSQPTSPPQTCAVTNGSGTLSGANATAVSINCVRTLVFRANDGATGAELWKSDGTDAGTVPVKDINDSGTNGSYPSELTVSNGTLYFRVDDGTGTGAELWKSDGTDAGTMMVKEINNIDGSDPSELTVFNGMVYFRADDGTGAELWKSDGTDAGTVMVKDINDKGGSDPSKFTVSNGTLYFRADDGGDGRELWKSDGTDAGTVMVKDINLSGNSIPVSSEFAVFNGEVYFTANDATGPGEELWKSDGTDAGTMMVKNINPGSANSDVSEFAVFNDALYFRARTGTDNFELWKTDGTDAGTMMVKDINGAPAGSIVQQKFAVFDGALYFTARDGINGVELWKTDGTDAGTMMVKNINTTPDDSASSDPSELTVFNGALYFTARDGINGVELWKTDGTDAGTMMVKNINTTPDDSASSDPSELTVF